MKKIVLASFALVALPFISTAQAANVNIKQDMINACVAQVSDKNITDKTSAQKLCTCQVNVQGRMTMEQSWEIDSWAQSGNNLASLPLYNNLIKNIQACGTGIKFNKVK